MKKTLLSICLMTLLIVSGCISNNTPAKQFGKIFDRTSLDEIYLWVPDLERIDFICKDAKKQFDISIASKMKNDVPLSEYEDEKTSFRKKTEEMLNQLQLEETDQFYENRILLRIGCEAEEKNYLVIYDDMTAKIIRIDQDFEVHETCYVLKSKEAVEEFLAYIDLFYERPWD